MSVQILTSNQGKIGYFDLDATLSENHTLTNEVTEFPVEQGFNISDHVIRKPEKLTIEGFVTNTPVSEGVAPLGVDRVLDCLNALLDMAGFSQAQYVNTQQEFLKVAQTLTIITGLRTYFDMVITSVVMPRTKDLSKYSMKFTVDLQRMVIVSTQNIIIQNTSELNGRAKNVSTKAAPAVSKNVTSATETPETILGTVQDWFSGKHTFGKIVG
jgi:hypothetical protein